MPCAFYACGLRRFFDQFTSVAGRKDCRALRRAERQRHGFLLIGIARFALQRQGNALSRRIIWQQLLQCAHRFHACAVKLREHIALFKARRGGRAAVLHCGEINALRNPVGTCNLLCHILSADAQIRCIRLIHLFARGAVHQLFNDGQRRRD